MFVSVRRRLSPLPCAISMPAYIPVCCVDAPKPVLAPKPPPGVAPGVCCPKVPPPAPKPVVVERPNPVRARGYHLRWLCELIEV